MSAPDLAEPTASLTIIIPAFNEGARLERTLDEIQRWLVSSALPEVELLVVDDGSTDRTASIAAAHPLAETALRVVCLPINRGKGAAVRAGVAEARGDHILFMDADLATPIEHYRDIARALSFADVAIGTRTASGSRVEARPLHRKAMSLVFNKLARTLVGVEVSDVLCGFKGFRRSAAQRIFAELRAERFAFDVELLGLARAHRLRVVEIPITWRHDARSTVRPLTHSFQSLAELCRIAYRLRQR